jgi:hypothetical protein
MTRARTWANFYTREKGERNERRTRFYGDGMHVAAEFQQKATDADLDLVVRLAQEEKRRRAGNPNDPAVIARKIAENNAEMEKQGRMTDAERYDYYRKNGWLNR